VLGTAPPPPARPLQLHSGPSAHEQLTRRHPSTGHSPPLPAPTGPAPYHLHLAEVLGATELDAIRRTGELRFHCVGDTGGHHNPIPQRAVIAAMATELEGERPVSFFFHLGDIVYLHGERANYDAQFFEPYRVYPAPILAVAGNHDGELAPGSEAGSLAAFVEQFCAPAHEPSPPERRPALHQPNVYWTLEHDWVTVIGLYSGVPEGGRLGDEQLRWLTGELRTARPEVTLILAMHHPVFSADRMHGSNLELRDALDACFASAGRAPDAVFSAHAHNYQRFTRIYEGREIPYVVAGSGGYDELHGLGYGVPDTPASFAALPDVTLEAHQHRAFGFMTVTCGPTGAQVDYSTVVRRRPAPSDTFAIRPASSI
jgi:3',5'-cyclic AMP phosphodiesterase CpdA